ncbi:hypothetical protein UACE39S_04816 [Ureibacillus acetophenoni]
MNYIMELRKVVGTKPLIMVGACVILLNEKGKSCCNFEKTIIAGG